MSEIVFPNDDGKEVLDFCGKNRCYIMEVRRLLNGRRFEFKNTIKISILDFTAVKPIVQYNPISFLISVKLQCNKTLLL